MRKHNLATYAFQKSRLLGKDHLQEGRGLISPGDMPEVARNSGKASRRDEGDFS